MSSIQYAVGLPQLFWRGNIFEGEDRLAQLGPKIHLELLITVGLIIWICEPLFYTVKDFFTVVFVLKMGFLHSQKRECMPALSSRSVGIGQKLLQVISSTVILCTRRWGV